MCLQNSVQHIPDLRQVRINMDFDRAKHGLAISYETYRDLLLEAAVHYDTTRIVNSRSRRIHYTQFEPPPSALEDPGHVLEQQDEYVDFHVNQYYSGINTPHEDYFAVNVTQQRNPVFHPLTRPTLLQNPPLSRRAPGKPPLRRPPSLIEINVYYVISGTRLRMGS
jgi:hypothetical protein